MTSLIYENDFIGFGSQNWAELTCENVIRGLSTIIEGTNRPNNEEEVETVDHNFDMK